MKKIAKGLAALLICGSFAVFNCENVEAAEVADLTTDSAEIQEMAHHRAPPPPRRPGPHRDDWRDPPPPRWADPPPPRWGDPPPPPHGDRDRHRQPPRPRW